MLLELRLTNVAVIDAARLTFARGMTALTGETGAGKSIVIDALGAVLGARVSSDIVRSGAREARVEALFDLHCHPQQTQLAAVLDEMGITLSSDEPLALARDISAAGRSTARIADRTVTAATLARVGALLVDVHGQSDHLSLLRPAEQLNMLDRFAGVASEREQMANAYAAWGAARDQLNAYDSRARDDAQRLDLLTFQAEELRLAQLVAGEDVLLERERSMLQYAERLAQGAAEIDALLNGIDADAPSVVTALHVVGRTLDDMERLDPELSVHATRLRDLLFELEDLAGDMRDYGERSQPDPQRLQEVDDRLALLRRLLRKYGPTLDEALAHWEQVERELDEHASNDMSIDAVREAEVSARRTALATAARLSERRRAAATTLAAATVQAIAELNMGRAAFEVAFDDSGSSGERQQLAALTPLGTDRITFMLAANAGADLRPLARVASGGETARIMLALQSILADADATPTLVFDEVDVGVGGRSGQVVGEKLWALTRTHQVVVISHLAQIAAFADQHLIMEKHDNGRLTTTTARLLDADDRVREIAAMLDGLPPTSASIANAQTLIDRVERWKADHAESAPTGSGR